jgi:hypothetical protein
MHRVDMGGAGGCRVPRDGSFELPPHAYGSGALLGVRARPAPTPNKPLAGRLALH